MNVQPYLELNPSFDPDGIQVISDLLQIRTPSILNLFDPPHKQGGSKRACGCIDPELGKGRISG
jgi:hypothetical protein